MIAFLILLCEKFVSKIMYYFVVGFLSIFLTSCSSGGAQYYRSHPVVLQHALQKCPQTHPGKMTCDQLAKLANEMNVMAYQLQSNPQEFGNTVLKAQEKLAQLEQQLSQNKNQPGLRTQVQQQKQQVAEYLAVVKWLESPEK